MTRSLGLLATDWPLRRLARDIVARYTGIYADELVRQQTPAGEPIPRVERLRDVVVRERAIRHSEEQLPAIVLAIPGTTDVGYRSGGGVYAPRFRIEVHSAYQSDDPDIGGEVASILAMAATRALIDGLPGGLDGRLGAASWEGFGTVELVPDRDDRTRHSAAHVLTVIHEDFMSIGELPDVTDPPIEQPPVDPGDLPVIDDTAVSITRKEIE